ncbi:hypothetical protein Y032_0014g2230 [Ancylostoma ceylanicum]|uniref:Uncharacterized protein n=1 Tax=Ancylostoma ceylanicum TaxID=53326 RepID=A0A016V9J0_9BILA|nr:hypothetical protein Y032_0014g2230 [Ancylostoma ceylanicum]
MYSYSQQFQNTEGHRSSPNRLRGLMWEESPGAADHNGTHDSVQNCWNNHFRAPVLGEHVAGTKAEDEVSG